MKTMMDEIIYGDCLTVMKNIDDNSIDAIITDPPYGIQFMGKDWDKAVPSVDIWKECLRVLKSGAFAFVMCIPRQDCLARMIINLEDAGFNVNFSSILHVFASGFPKGSNLSKMVDRRLGVEKEIVGHQKITGQALGVHKGLGLVDNVHKIEWDITKPSSPQAKRLDGWYAGCQLKPAYEVILVIQKPLNYKSNIDHAFEWCKQQEEIENGERLVTDIAIGGINVDGCRIPCDSQLKTGAGKGELGNSYHWSKTERQGGKGEGSLQGRFPANLLVSGDILNDGIIKHTHATGQKHEYKGKQENVYGDYSSTKRILDYGNNSGSFSRYFDLDAWFSEKLKQLPENIQKTFPFMIVPKPSKKEKTNDGRVENKHPTCKSIKLMSYLIILGSHEGGIVLDPFVGSGTTAIAVKMFNRHYIGIDISEEYCQIAIARMELIY